MSDFKNWKNKERGQNIAEKFGLKFDINALGQNKKEYDLDENADDRIFAPNHYCAHHVRYEGREGHTVDHNWNEELQEVTRYDVKFEDGTVARDIPVNELEVLEAKLAEGHGGKAHPPAKRDSPKTKKKARPDYPDIDGDGDKDEPMAKAAADKKKKVQNEEQEEEIEERRGRGRKGPHTRGVPDPRLREVESEDESESTEQDALEELIRKHVRSVLEELKNES